MWAGLIFVCAKQEMNELPNDLIERVLWYVDTETLFECTKVCKKWKQIVEPGDSRIWKFRYLPIENHVDMFDYISSDLVKELPHEKAKIKALMCTWNEDDCSETLYMKEDLVTVHRNPIAKSTDSIRSKTGFIYGRHRFLFVFNGPEFGSHAMIGVCTEEAPLRIRSYDNMLGITPHAWGWDLVNNVLRHNGAEYGTVDVSVMSIVQSACL